MKLEKRHMQIALVILLASLVYNVWVFMWPRGPEVTTMPPPLLGAANTARPPVGAAVPAIDPATIPAPPAVDLAAAPVWARDPFLADGEARHRSLVETAVPLSFQAPVVRSILVSGERRLALVDGKIVKAGDRIAAGEVVAVSSSGIVIRTASGERREVSLRRSLGLGEPPR